MEIAENEGWKKGQEEDLNKIKILSKRLIDGVEEEGLKLGRLHIPGLSRYYIRRLVGAGYGDEEKFKNTSGVELGKLLPERLVQRIQKRIKEKDIQKATRQKLIAEAENCEPAILPSLLKTTNTTSVSHNLQPVSASSLTKAKNPNFNLKSKNQKLKTVLEISLNRPDRIIFMGKKIEVTSTEFSLINSLIQCKMSLKVRVMLLVFYQIIYPFPTVLF